jgi:hypothetical protein
MVPASDVTTKPTMKTAEVVAVSRIERIYHGHNENLNNIRRKRSC